MRKCLNRENAIVVRLEVFIGHCKAPSKCTASRAIANSVLMKICS